MRRARRLIALALIALALLAPGCVTLTLADEVARTREQPKKTFLCAVFPFALVADVAFLGWLGFILLISPDWLNSLWNDDPSPDVSKR